VMIERWFGAEWMREKVNGVEDAGADVVETQ
jgi:hypothetical protein